MAAGWPTTRRGGGFFFERDESANGDRACRIRLAHKPSPGTQIGIVFKLVPDGAAYLFSAQHLRWICHLDHWQSGVPPQEGMLVYFEDSGKELCMGDDVFKVAHNICPVPESDSAWTAPPAQEPPQPPPLPYPPAPVAPPPLPPSSSQPPAFIMSASSPDPNAFAQVPFGQPGMGANTFAANPENRCPILLLLDTSFSMDGQPIAELNQALQQFAGDLQTDTLAAKRAEIAIATFGPVQTVCDFVTADSFYPPALQCTGDTPLGAALLHGIDMIARRKALYKANGIMYYRPKIFLLTDGAPTDDWQNAADAVKGGEVTNDFSFYPIGVQGADMNVLREISTITPLRLKGLQFSEMFAWLSSSISAVSRSMPGDEVQLQNPVTPNGWATF